MMIKSSVVRARIEPELKERVEDVLEQIGLNTTEAIRLYFKQIVMQGGIPFDVRIPNTETIKAIEAVEKGEGLKEYKNAEEMFKELGI